MVREQAFGDLTPPYMAGGIGEYTGDRVGAMLAHESAPHMFESGTRNLAVVSVLTDAVAWLEGLGWDWVEQRERMLATRLRGQLRELRGVRVLTPDAWEHSSALTSFSIEDGDALPLQQSLWEERIITRWVPERNALRIATAYFNDEGDLDCLVEALTRLLPGRGV